MAYNPTQMYDYSVNVVKGGFVGQPWTVDKVAPINDADVDPEFFRSGRIVHLDDNGRWNLGVPLPTVTVAPVPYILWPNARDYDVIGFEGNITGALTAPGSASPNPWINASQPSALCCAATSEVETTEFDASVNYAPGEFLTALVYEDGTPGDGETDDPNEAGRVVKVDGSYAEIIVGVVSEVFSVAGLSSNPNTHRNPNLNHHNKPILKFITTFIPRFETSE